jgi:hypothetical protein
MQIVKPLLEKKNMRHEGGLREFWDFLIFTSCGPSVWGIGFQL